MERVRIGDYRLEAELTASATARLYRATHQVLPRQAMIKIACEPAGSVAVLREACLLAALPHCGIVRVYEVGRLADNRTWFASEIVDGLTVAGMLELGALDPMTVVAIVRDAAEILAHAHQRGIVHGALTPDRIVLTSRLRGFPLCITDWSSARTHDAQSIQPAATGPYTAPELVRGELDDRADVFALGVLAHRAFTGQVPDGAPVSSLAPDLPAPLAKLVEQMLAYDRWDRPSSAEIRSELAGMAVVAGEAGPGMTAPPAEVRIRRPRWTPPLELAPDDAAEALLDAAPTLDDITKRQ